MVTTLERLLGRVDVALEVVDHEHLQVPSGWCSVNDRAEHPRVRDVVLGDDRADVHWATRLRRCATLKPP